MAFASGTKLGPYEIHSPLGAGGMGEVYRATDSKLGRDVALKVLPTEMAQDPERLARFRREAKTLAQLDHPNIVTIYTVEECDSVHVLTMQLVEGQPLDRLIPASGLPVEQIVEIASALGDALAAAHEKGIVHRDLKPANVMVSNEGRVKVLDFGLAKDVRTANVGDATLTSSQTQVGVVMGTPAYMSPEQTSGRPLDHRTDIFSLGVVLHEMATGQRPFNGESSAELVSSILRDTPPSVTDVRPDLPSDLARIIRRCLEKDPRHRVQTARDVSNEFRDLARQTSQKAVPAKTSTSRVAAVKDSGAARADEGFWVAVLPFRAASGDADLEALADGLTEAVTTGLSRFPYLQVIANNSAMAYKGRAADIRTVGRELGARYVIEGSIRKGGRAIRVTAQLMDAMSGTQLWAEAYDREIADREGNEAGTFQIQDDLTDHIVTTVADGYGVLVRSMAAPTRDRKVEELSASELVLRYYAFMQQINPQEHAVLRAGLERALEREPNHATAWACLSNLYQLEYFDRFNPLEKPLERAREAAWRAVKIDPACQMGWKELAAVYFFSRDFTAFRETAERAMSLNSRDSTTLAFMALMIAFSGDWERGMALAQRAIELNRHHPGWYHNIFFHHHYRKGEYESALQAAKKINMPEFHWMHLMTAAACGMLGRHEEARAAIESLRKYNPTFLDLANVREDIEMWDPHKEEVEQLLQGLQKAGMKYGSADSAATDSKQTDSIQTTTDPKLKSDRAAAARSASIASTPASDGSGAALREDDGFWVAVLPFKYGGTNAELKALADGLSEEIVTGLSRFSYLRVIARGSTAKYSSEVGDVRAISKELGARYVMEGNLRQAGTKLRLAAQVVDAVSGTHLWAETYERTFSAENIFALQDDLVPRIVSTVADGYGILPHNICEALRRKPDDQLTPHEAVLRAFSYYERITPQEHAQVRAILERAARSAPGQCEIWAMLSTIYWHEYAHGFNLQTDPLGRALGAARRSVDASPSNNLGHSALATTLFLQKNFLAFRPAAERAIELNPMDGSNLATMGLLMAYSGDWEHGCALVESALQLNPHHPGWYWFAHFFNAYRKGDYRGALSIALKFNMPGYFYTHALTAAVYGQLGMREPAQKALQELLAIRPDFALVARQEFDKFYDSELVEQLIDGLSKAGLEIAPGEGTVAAAPDRAQASSSVPDSGVVRAEEGSFPTKGVSGIKRQRIALAVAVILLVIGAAGVAAYLKTSKTGQIDSIAVLPMENRSNDPDADYIPDGITESINNSLARLPSLTVIPHSVAFHYKGKAMDVRKVGDELHVQAVLTGSVAQRGDNLTVEVELDDVRNGKQLWGEEYKRKLADLLAVQNEIAREVSQRLRAQVSAADQQKLTKGSTDSPEAYRLYLKGKYYTDKFTKEGFDTGIDYFNQAIAVDPNYGLAYSGLAYNYVNQMDWYMSPSDAGPKTKEAAEKALAIDGSDARAHLTLAIETHWYEWKWAAAENEFKRTIELSPNNSEAFSFYAWFLAPMGRNDDALAEARRAQEADPLSSLSTFGTGAVLLFARQWDPAIEQLRRAIEVDPNFWFSHCFLGRAYEQKRKFPEAIAEFQRALEIEKDNGEIWSGLGHAYAVSGRKAEAQKVLDHLKELSAHSWVAPYNIAVIYAGLGEKDQAFALLERAYKDRSYYMATYLATDERLDNLRPDPRFADLRRRVGLPE